MVSIFSESPSASTALDVAASSGSDQLTESFTERETDQIKSGNLLTRVFGSTIKRATNRVIQKKRQMEGQAEQVLENALTRHNESIKSAGQGIQQGLTKVTRAVEYVKDGSAAADVVAGKVSANFAKNPISKIASRIDTHQGREQLIEGTLTRHSEALTTAATKAKTAKRRVSAALDSIAESIATEAGAGVDVVRKSAAYKVASGELALELGVNLRKNQTLTAEQKQQLSAQVKGDAETIKRTLAQRVESILIDNKSVDITRSAIRERLQHVVEESVEAISDLTQDLRAVQVKLQQKEEEGSGGSHSTIVGAIGGAFSGNPAKKESLTSKRSSDRKATTADDELAATAEKPQGKDTEVAVATTATPPIAAALPTAVEAIKPALKVVQGGKGAVEDTQAALGQLTGKQLIFVAQRLKATGQQELSIPKYGRLRKIDLLKALNSDAALAYLSENKSIVERAATITRVKKKKTTQTTATAAAAKKADGSKTTKVKG